MKGIGSWANAAYGANVLTNIEAEITSTMEAPNFWTGTRCSIIM